MTVMLYCRFFLFVLNKTKVANPAMNKVLGDVEVILKLT